jgi:hypothetical protein
MCQLNWIFERHEIARRSNVLAATAYGPVPGYRHPSAPWPLWLLGEHGKAQVLFYFSDAKRQALAGNGDSEAQLTQGERAELARARILFPESDVVYCFAATPRK